MIDLWWPRAAPGGAPGCAGVVVVLHGGFWRSTFDRVHARPECVGFADAGYLVAAVEYRRTGRSRLGRREGGWPWTLQDVAAALDALPQLLSGSSVPAGIDVDALPPPVLVGHSAGGHLAAWAAARHLTPPGSPGHASSPPALSGAVSLAGVLDLAEAYRLDLDGGAVRALLGGGPDAVPDRYAAADPVRLVPPRAPVTCLHGTDDDVVPIDLSRRYVEAARGAGGEAALVELVEQVELVELVELPGVEHFALIDPESAAWPHVLAAVSALLHRDGPRWRRRSS